MVVWLHSRGGSIGALGIGDLIHDYGLQTYVPAGAECDSLCAYLWLAGSKRFVGYGAHIGFHMPHPVTKVTTKDDRLMLTMLGMYFGRMLGANRERTHINYDFAQWVVNAGTSDKVLYLTRELADKFGIDSRWFSTP